MAGSGYVCEWRLRAIGLSLEWGQEMAVFEGAAVDERYLPTGDESGTAPSDRRFRPDVEGLRAVAVLLVVFYHAGFTSVSGGYVGVDVFFVISGFVITGVLLRERDSSGKVSILGFYGRRARRIIPAATLVIIATSVAAYLMLGVVYGDETATDARWTSVFLANFHFAASGTNYLTATQLPSLLQNFWSLAVEEQFYLVYPAIFLVVASLKTRASLATKLVITLGVGIVASLAFSVLRTSSNPTAAFFSPFTRAWELALGALVAVATRWLLLVPKHIGAVMTWAGLAAIAFAALVFNNNTPYPGSAVAVPVIGAALVIAGGVTVPADGAETLLRLAPFQWMGKLSYSMYLWHWPILLIAAYYAGKASLPFSENILWIMVALVASIGTYLVLENPVRHAQVLTRRRWPPIVLGLALIATSLGVATLELRTHASPDTGYWATANATVAQLVAAAPAITTLPNNLEPSLVLATHDFGSPPGGCWPTYGQDTLPACIFGDRTGTKSMVLYGDSHAGMWFAAMNKIARKAHWRLIMLAKGGCPAGLVTVRNPPGWRTPGNPFAECNHFHRFAIERINQIHPDLLIVSQEVEHNAKGQQFTAAQWQQGLSPRARTPDSVLTKVPPWRVTQ
jgi:peptidoglycan/LPS O-acetylase OafA/YrhL